MIRESDYKTQLNENGVISIIPSGFSMWPFLKNKGQSVIIEKINKSLKKFDVVLYERADKTLVLHRIIEILDGEYILQGDSQFYVEKVKKENIIGVMVGFYKGKKYIPATNEKYLKKVEKWCRKGTIVKSKIKCFYLRLKIKSKLKRIFCKKGS